MTRRVALRHLICISIPVLCGASSAQNAPMFRNDLAHSGIYAAPGVPVFHRVKWAFHTGGEVVSSPAVFDGVVYVGSNDGKLYAIDQQTGTQKWSFAAKSRIPSSPAVSGGLVYFPSYDGNFYAVDAATGQQRWKFADPGERRYTA